MNRIEPVKPAAKLRNPVRTKRNSVFAAVVIVAVSVVAINFAVKTLSGAHEYLVADASAAAGTVIKDLPLRTISLNLGEASEQYLSPGTNTEGLLLSQPLAKGQLVLKRDLEPVNQTDSHLRLAITAKTALPTKLEAGSKIDVWAAVNDGAGSFGEPQLIAQNVQVWSIGSGGAAIFGDSNNKLELSLTPRDIKPILAAVLHADAMTVIAHNEVG